MNFKYCCLGHLIICKVVVGFRSIGFQSLEVELI